MPHLFKSAVTLTFIYNTLSLQIARWKVGHVYAVLIDASRVVHVIVRPVVEHRELRQVAYLNARVRVQLYAFVALKHNAQITVERAQTVLRGM